MDRATCERIAAHSNNNLRLGREWWKQKQEEGWFDPPPKATSNEEELRSELRRLNGHWLVRLGRFLKLI